MPERNATDRGVKHKNELLRSDDIFGLNPKISSDLEGVAFFSEQIPPVLLEAVASHCERMTDKRCPKETQQTGE